jgi:hypothetical protein
MATNLPKSNKPNATTEFFNQYDAPTDSSVVNANEYDAVRGFFLRKTNDNETVADGLTGTVMSLSNLHNVSPMDLIDDFTDYALTDIQQALVSLINQTRANTSILGFNRNKTPSQTIARNILV